MLAMIVLTAFVSLGGTGADAAGITWNLDSSGTLTISGTGDMPEYGYNSLKDEPEVPWYAQKDEIRRVVIEDGVTSIGDYAFLRCSNLTSVTIPDSVERIEQSAFTDCVSLTDLVIPDSVTEVGEYAFSHCNALTSVTLPDSLTSISDHMFSGCRDLKTVILPDSITAIGEAGFSGCPSLTDIVIPDSVTALGDGAFGSCTGLGRIRLPDSVTSIGAGAFENCWELVGVTLPNDVPSVSERLFSGCSKLLTVSIPDGVTSIGENAFWRCSSLRSVSIPASVQTVEAGAFSHCDALTSLYYNGTEQDWGKISIQGDNDSVQSAGRFTGTDRGIPFTDVAPASYYYKAVAWAVDQKITNGTTETTFTPDRTCSQSEILTMLYRAFGSPASSGVSPYTNEGIRPGRYFYDALLWAYEKGIVTDTGLDPYADCCRADVVMYLWRLNGNPAASGQSFGDVPQTAPYSQAVAWAVQEGIVNGISLTEFAPDRTCTRGEIVTFLYRAFVEPLD